MSAGDQILAINNHRFDGPITKEEAREATMNIKGDMTILVGRPDSNKIQVMKPEQVPSSNKVIIYCD